MRAAYPTKKLGDLCHIARGGSPRPIQSYLTDAPDGISWIKISDATASQKYIEYTKEKIRPEGLKKSRLVKPGDFILSNSMSFGRPYIMKTTGCIHDGWLVLSDKCGLFDQDYLFHFLGSDAAYRQFDKLAAGSTVRNLNSDLVKTVDVPLPPLEEQRWIVAVLDEAFAAIATATANAEKNLANARELFDATLRETFANPDPSAQFLTLKQASLDFGRGKSKHRPRNDPKLYGGEYPFIQTGDVRNCEHLITEYSQTYCTAGLAQSKLWPKGTICITIAANIAETGILTFDACFPDSVIGMVVDPNRTSSSYAEYLLQSLKAVLQAKGKGSAQDNLNLAAFENERFPFPPKAIQLSIVERLGGLSEQVQAMEALYGDKLIALTSLKQSLLHRAFTGELTATVLDTIAA